MSLILEDEDGDQIKGFGHVLKAESTSGAEVFVYLNNDRAKRLFDYLAEAYDLNQAVEPVPAVEYEDDLARDARKGILKVLNTRLANGYDDGEVKELASSYATLATI